MAVYKAVVHDKYAQIPNETLQDSTISFEARGLLAMLLSMPPHWEVHKAWVVSQSSAGKDKVNAIFKELEQAGYIRKEEGQRKFGKFSHDDYFVFPEKHTVADLPQRIDRSGLTGDGESSPINKQLRKETERKKQSIGTSDDAPCSVCHGYGLSTGDVEFGTPCSHCNGTGKEPTCKQSLQVADVRNSRTTEQQKPKKLSKAQALFNLVRENAQKWPALNCVDDELLSEWARLRTRKGASSEDRALNTIEKTLEELRTIHGIAPDAALAAQCDSGWTTVKVEYFVKNGRGMSYAGAKPSPYDDSSDFRDILGDML